MGFLFVNTDELSALMGLPHIQQLTYLLGIRPYMDRDTYLVGIKRKISYQSLSEVLYVEPHQGYEHSGSPSRQQLRRVIYALEKAGIVKIQSVGKQLILKCILANSDLSVQNKPDTNPTHQTNTTSSTKFPLNTKDSRHEYSKPDTPKILKADTPLIKENNYIYLLQRFDHFWNMYPEKKSRERAFEVFQKINPDEPLLQRILQALYQQILARETKEAHGEWVPAWKFPANWLSQKSWEDEIKNELEREKRNEKCGTNTKSGAIDPFWNPETGDEEITSEDVYQQSNVISLQRYRE